MNHERTPLRKTGAGGTGPPEKYVLPLPDDLSRCKSCPYPGVGFICWSPDGSCLKTSMSRRSKGR